MYICTVASHQPPALIEVNGQLGLHPIVFVLPNVEILMCGLRSERIESQRFLSTPNFGAYLIVALNKTLGPVLTQGLENTLLFHDRFHYVSEGLVAWGKAKFFLTNNPLDYRFLFLIR